MVQLISESAELIAPELLKPALGRIEDYARISHGSEDKSGQGEEATRRFIKAVVIDHGDWSVVEHVTATALFVIDRGASHELVRHRLASYTQSSTRFINYLKGRPPQFIYPYETGSSQPSSVWLGAMDIAARSYEELIMEGWRPQEARGVLPNALATKVAMTCNLRNWRHFFIMRTTVEAHPQIRRVSISLLEQFQAAVPLLFDDIIPLSRQADNLRLPR